MNKINFAFAALLIAALITACGIATGSFTFGYELDGPIDSSSATLDREVIDLNSIEDYNDHKDQIKSVDNVALVGWVANNGPQVSGEVWLVNFPDSMYTDPDTVRYYGTRIFVSPVIPSGDTLMIDWSDGLSYIENFAAVQDAVEGGQFVLYGLGDDPNFDVYMNVNVIITITAGL